VHILLYEYFSGGGLWTEAPGGAVEHELLGEGRAMLDALAADLRRCSGVRVTELRDARLDLAEPASAAGTVVPIGSAREEREQLEAWSRRVDGVLLVAPEYDGRLLERARWVAEQGGRLLSADPAFIALTTDKSRTAAALAQAGVPVPASRLLAPGEPLPSDMPLPLVLKPNDGAGSRQTYLVRDEAEAAQLRRVSPDAARVEAWCPGVPASVLALCGPRRRLDLPPCEQHVDCRGALHYRGGRFPLGGGLRRRACRLSRAALAALPRTCGFVGVDLILGADPDGTQDVVLEINPRLTTSYVALRRAAHTNLAAAMLAILRGQCVPLFFRHDTMEFDADGHVRTIHTPASAVP
jgi:hypothetical protein